MNNRNVIIAIIVVVAIVIGGLAIWSSSPSGKELVNKIEKKIDPDTYQDWKEVAKESIKKEGEEQLNDYYVNLQVQAALLKAKLAAESKDTYDQAYKDLDEAKRWYNRNNYEASIMLDSTTQNIIIKIDEAQEYLIDKKDEAGVLISDILSEASELVKDDDQ